MAALSTAETTGGCTTFFGEGPSTNEAFLTTALRLGRSQLPRRRHNCSTCLLRSATSAAFNFEKGLASQ
jgi:hypothetical protein